MPQNVHNTLKSIANDPLKAATIYFPPSGNGGDNIMSYYQPVQSLGTLSGLAYKTFSRTQKKWIRFNAFSGDRRMLGRVKSNGKCSRATSLPQLIETVNTYLGSKWVYHSLGALAAEDEIRDQYGNKLNASSYWTYLKKYVPGEAILLTKYSELDCFYKPSGYFAMVGEAGIVNKISNQFKSEQNSGNYLEKNKKAQSYFKIKNHYSGK